MSGVSIYREKKAMSTLEPTEDDRLKPGSENSTNHASKK